MAYAVYTTESFEKEVEKMNTGRLKLYYT